MRGAESEDDVVAAIREVFAAYGVRGEPEDADAWRIDDLLSSHAHADAVVEGVDFDRRLYPLRYAGHRAVAQNLADLYAVDAEPVAILWSLAVPEAWSLDDVLSFCRGAAALCGAVGCPLLGGDLSVTSGPFVCAITVFGRAAGLAVKRSGAKAGQGIWLSRPVGASARGLRLLREASQDCVGDDEGRFHQFVRGLSPPDRRAVLAHVEPAPFHGLQNLSDFAVAAIDVSDGLLRDAARLARTSGVGIELDRLDDAVDVAAGATVDDALHGGEDWALLFAVPDGLVPPGCVRIGRTVPGAGVTWRGQPLDVSGWDHFRGSPRAR